MECEPQLWSDRIPGLLSHIRRERQNILAASVGNNVLTATIPGLSDATTYVFWVSAYNSAGLESSRSNEVPTRPTGSGYYLTVRIMVPWLMAPVTALTGLTLPAKK